MNKAHNTMSPEEQNIAIAEAYGWTQISRNEYDHRTFRREIVGQTPNGVTNQTLLPDHPNDLNACREFEIWLLKNHPDLRAVYRRILIECVGSDGLYWMATAPQRCEAFLRTTNKWVSAPLKQ